MLTAVPELLDSRLIERRKSKSHCRTKFVLNGNQDWCPSLGIGHVKSLTVGFPKHAGLGFIGVELWFIYYNSLVLAVLLVL